MAYRSTNTTNIIRFSQRFERKLVEEDDSEEDILIQRRTKSTSNSVTASTSKILNADYEIGPTRANKCRQNIESDNAGWSSTSTKPRVTKKWSTVGNYDGRTRGRGGRGGGRGGGARQRRVKNSANAIVEKNGARLNLQKLIEEITKAVLYSMSEQNSQTNKHKMAQADIGAENAEAGVASTPDFEGKNKEFDRLRIEEEDSEEEIVIRRRAKPTTSSNWNSSTTTTSLRSAGVCPPAVNTGTADDHRSMYACIGSENFEIVFVPWYIACNRKVTNWRGGAVSDQLLVELLYCRHLHFHWYDSYMTLDEEGEWQYCAGPKKLGMLQTV